MFPPAFVPDRGDLVWLDFDPQAGSEQSGHRPALALSRANFHTRTGFAYAVPITTRAKGYPDEFPLSSGGPVFGVL